MAAIRKIVILGQAEAGVVIARSVSPGYASGQIDDDRLTGRASEMRFGQTPRQFTRSVSIGRRFRNDGRRLAPSLRRHRAQRRHDHGLAAQIRLGPPDVVDFVRRLRRFHL